MSPPHKRQPRGYRQSLLLAVIAVYLPAVLPLLVTPLTIHGESLARFLRGRELAVVYSPAIALLGILYYAIGMMLL